MIINVDKSKFKRLTRRFAFIFACLMIVQANVLANKSLVAESPSNAMMQQNEKVTIQGVITDAQLGEPMIGVSVYEKGTTNGTVSDLDGKFQLNVSNNSTVVFSIVGFKTQEIKVQGAQTLNIVMAEDEQLLEEVVVIGYGASRKQDLSMSISTVKVDEKMKSRAGGLNSVLQGQVSGLTIQMNGGDPTSGASFNLRGKGSRGGDGVLFVVDGVPGAPFNVEDVETITVLKDAASAAIYGAQVGAGGVVVVTTKKAKAGKISIDANISHSIKNEWKRPDVVTAEQFTQIWQDKKNSSVGNVNIPGSYDVTTFPYAGVTRTDWIDEVFRTAHSQHYALTLTGGSETMKALASVAFDRNEGILLNTFSQGVNAKLNTEFQIAKWLKFTENVTASYSNGRGGVSSNSHTGVLMRSIFYPRSQTVYEYALNPNNPLELGEPLYNEDGSRQYGGTVPIWAAEQGISSSGDFANPVASLLRVRDDNPSINIYSTSGLEIKPISKLTIQSNFTYAFNSYRNNRFSFKVPEIGRTSKENNKNVTTQWWHKWLWETYATYVEEVGKSNFSLMGGFSMQRESNRNLSVTAYGFDSENQYVTQLQNATEGVRTSNPATEARTIATLNSFFLRGGYSYDDRYFFTGSIRRDATSKLFKDQNSGIFPAFSASWKISSEEFWKNNVSFINLFKLRAGWGQVGNVALVPHNSYSALYKGQTKEYYGVFGENMVSQQGYYLRTIPNLALTWETTQQTSLGLDFTLLDNSLNISVDYFNKITKDLIEKVENSPQAGYEDDPYGNVGKVRNTGWEFQADYRKKVENVTFNVFGNVSTVKNEVLDLGGVPELTPHNITMDGGTNPKLYSAVGKPWYSYKLIQTDGLFQTQEEIDKHVWINPTTGETKKLQPNAVPGDLKFVDANNDGLINDNDRVYMGSFLPELTYSFGGGFEWNGFDFSFMFQGISNIKIYNGLKMMGETGKDNGYFLTSVLDSWTYNHSSSTPRLSMGSDPNKNYSTASDYFLEDGSYLRLKNITLGYTLPKNTMKKMGFDGSLRLYVGGENLATFTKYSGFDPEVSNNGVDAGTYPIARMFTFGLNLSF